MFPRSLARSLPRQIGRIVKRAGSVVDTQIGQDVSSAGNPPSVAASNICLNMLGQWIDPRLPLMKSIALHPISFAGKQRHDLLGVGTDLAELARASIKRSR